ncbi:unnamed protein product [Polarella glacialis]|uniref:Uncharacterized protein n=1 Tax=Polarella glacialis TaxID=89957 RepID=A0A813FK52_POLGL|nr:unnamed protein product [Polarella glacialis]
MGVRQDQCSGPGIQVDGIAPRIARCRLRRPVHNDPVAWLGGVCHKRGFTDAFVLHVMPHEDLGLQVVHRLRTNMDCVQRVFADKLQSGAAFTGNKSVNQLGN